MLAYTKVYTKTCLINGHFAATERARFQPCRPEPHYLRASAPEVALDSVSCVISRICETASNILVFLRSRERDKCFGQALWPARIVPDRQMRGYCA